MENKYNKALEMCTDNKSTRAWMQKPFFIEDKVYATNSYIMLIVPKAKTDGIPPLEGYEHDPYEIIKVVPEEHESVLKLSIQQVRDLLKKAPQIEEVIPPTMVCPDCDGEGEVMCDYCGYEHECKRCDGSGYLDRPHKTGKMIPDPSTKIKIGSNIFAPKLVDLMLNVMSVLGFETAELIYDRQTKGALFSFGDCRFILMPKIFEKPDIEVV